jgi:hypothetical protein
MDGMVRVSSPVPHSYRPAPHPKVIAAAARPGRMTVYRLGNVRSRYRREDHP